MKTFTVRDYKGVREIQLSPTGRLVVIAGGNGAGKSSFIDAIAELFDPRGVKLTPKPIREGAEQATAEYIDEDLGLRITRTWRKNGTAGTLAVEALDGAKYSRPSEVVADLLGGAIFDPVAFLNMDERAQRDALLSKVTLPFDPDDLARQKAGAEQRRLEAGREVKRLEGALASLPKPAPGTPDAEVSPSEVLAQIEHAQQIDRQWHAASAEYDAAAARWEELDRQIAELLRQRDEVEQRQARAAERLNTLPEQIPLEPLQAKLRDLDAVNQAVRERQAWERASADLAHAGHLWKAAQTALEEIEATKRAGLAEATFPIPGLSVTDEGVTFEGVPFSQVNSAMRRRIAFAIATAGNPKLRLVIVKDGDLLDADSLRSIADLAEERGYTVLVERDRDESRRIGFTIRDGALSESAAEQHSPGLPPIEEVAAAAGLHLVQPSES
ncbi:ATP-binding cassette domain-containing protein [Microbacterium resistens]|uniref:ATP-binding cassette domain-containing protein n=1 Tax=Microbacterium resistens TaxID=156977 RepID=UPI001C579D7D|nr:ATP-binding cassette domain-containing protein [Microbacterium resistens]MBW1639280.1 ATP-binding cassette domain-containing protein [Microbacterium resistens]